MRQAAYACGAVVSLAYAVTGTLTACDKQGHLSPGAATAIEAVNAAACQGWMPIASSALAAKAPPFAVQLFGSFGCSGEEAAVDAIFKELVASAPSPAADAGTVGFAASAYTAASTGLVPITRARDGKVILEVPPAMAAECRAAQARVDARAQ